MIDFGKHFIGDTFVIGYTAKGGVTLEKANIALEGPEGSLISKSGKCAVEANRVTLKVTPQLAPVRGEYQVFFSNIFSDGSERSLPAKFELIERGWGETTQDVIVKQSPASPAPENLPPKPRDEEEERVEKQPSEGDKQPKKRDEEVSSREDDVDPAVVTEVDGSTIVEIDDDIDSYDWLLTAEYLMGGTKEEEQPPTEEPNIEKQEGGLRPQKVWIKDPSVQGGGYYQTRMTRPEGTTTQGPGASHVEDVQNVATGGKPAALVDTQAASEAERLGLRTFKVPQGTFGPALSNKLTHVVVKPGQEANAQKVLDVFKKYPITNKPRPIEYHRELGEALGYSREAIDAFIDRIRPQLEKGVAITPEVNTPTYGEGAIDSLPNNRKKRKIEKATSSGKAREIGDKLGIDWKEVDLDQFRRGLKVELEHTKDPETRVVKPQDLLSVGKIAWAHLKEKKDYYSRLEQVEKQDRGMSVKAIIRNEEGRILLIRDASSSYWDLPGGHVANSETVEEALRREVKEEVGLELTEASEKETRLLTLGDEERPVAFYDCRAKGGVKLSSEHSTYKWVHPHAFKSYNLGAFKNILCGKPDRVFQKQGVL